MLRPIALTLALALATPAGAQHAHGTHSLPTETGQATFAAIAEIVAQLLQDPKTDWSKVDIDGLRAHLLDMDRVTMSAEVNTQTSGDSVTFRVTGTGATIGAIQRMTQAHAGMLRSDAAWTVDVSPMDDGAQMTIALGSPEDMARVTGLGFFGIMTIGAHHQMHHLHMAKGGNPHH